MNSLLKELQELKQEHLKRVHEKQRKDAKSEIRQCINYLKTYPLSVFVTGNPITLDYFSAPTPQAGAKALDSTAVPAAPMSQIALKPPALVAEAAQGAVTQKIPMTAAAKISLVPVPARAAKPII